MTATQILERLSRLDRLIRLHSTGNPKTLAEKLGISERQVYYCIDDLKDLGLPVQYCRYRQTYYYGEPVRLSIRISIVDLSGPEEISIIGGLVQTVYFLHYCNKIAV